MNGIGFRPLSWQRRLYRDHFLSGELPAALDLPTGLGKTAVMAIWYLALKAGAPLPRRLVYVVDRRAVVGSMRPGPMAGSVESERCPQSLRDLSLQRGSAMLPREEDLPVDDRLVRSSVDSDLCHPPWPDRCIVIAGGSAKLREFAKRICLWITQLSGSSIIGPGIWPSNGTSAAHFT